MRLRSKNWQEKYPECGPIGEKSRPKPAIHRHALLGLYARMFIHLDKTPECDGRTDGQTDR